MTAAAPPPFIARSLLFAPGDNQRKLEKALASDADVVIADLEDSVALAGKQAARALVAGMLHREERRPGFWVRVNPLDGPQALPDLAAVVPGRPDGIMLPKASPADGRRLHHYLEALEAAAGLPAGGIPVIAIATETPAAVFALGAWAETPRLAALTWGAEDIAAAIGASGNRDERGGLLEPYRIFRTLALTAAAAAGVPAIEGVHPDFRDADGLARVAAEARRDGFSGMMAIHPDQVAPINAAFTPAAKEVAWAERVLAAFGAEPGAGVVSLDGKMLDLPHLKQAERVLVRAGRAGDA